MSKAILISIRPQHVTKILNGQKTVIIQKTAPKCKEFPLTVYIYCTKNSPKHRFSVGSLYLQDDDCYKDSRNGKYVYGTSICLAGYESYGYHYDENNFLNGKVVAKFTLWNITHYVNGCCLEASELEHSQYLNVIEGSCLTEEELLEYGGEDLSVTAWRIDDLEVFDEPKSLSEFKYEKKKTRLGKDYHWHVEKCGLVPVTKDPTSWMYVEAER